jgi:uncharacterized Tic20 family protein
MTEYPPSGPSGDPNIPPAAPQYGQQPPQYGAAPGYGAPTGPAGVSDADRKLWGMLAHLGGIVLGFIAPLIVWAMYKDRDEFLKDQSTEALNFQITILIAYVASMVLTFIFIGILTSLATFVINIVFCIIGGMAANRGERYRYPFALRLVK